MRDEMKRTGSVTTNPIERSLWHGTAPATVPGINTRGFDRSFCGKNGLFLYLVKLYIELFIYKVVIHYGYCMIFFY